MVGLDWMVTDKHSSLMVKLASSAKQRAIISHQIKNKKT